MAILEEKIEEIATYFLFGEDACRMLFENGQEAFLEWEKDNTDFDVFKFSDVTDPKSLLDAFIEWGDYQVITQDLYIKLSQ
jgi:hypothetical protein